MVAALAFGEFHWESVDRKMETGGEEIGAARGFSPELLQAIKIERSHFRKPSAPGNPPLRRCSARYSRQTDIAALPGCSCRSGGPPPSARCAFDTRAPRARLPQNYSDCSWLEKLRSLQTDR